MDIWTDQLFLPMAIVMCGVAALFVVAFLGHAIAATFRDLFRSKGKVLHHHGTH